MLLSNEKSAEKAEWIYHLHGETYLVLEHLKEILCNLSYAGRDLIKIAESNDGLSKVAV